MRGAVDAHRNAFAGSGGAGGNLQRRAQLVLLETRTDGECEPRRLGRHRLQLQQFLLLYENQNGGRMQKYAEAVCDVLDDRCDVGQAMQRGGDFDQNAGAPVLFAGKLVQAKGFERRAQLSRHDRDFGDGVFVKAGIRRTLHECDSTHHIARNQQRRGHDGMRVCFRQPWIMSSIEAVGEERATLANRFHRDGWIADTLAHATKRFRLFAIGFGSNQFTVRGATPIIGAAGTEEDASQCAERQNELAGLAALESGAGKPQQKLLEILLRLRPVPRFRISHESCQHTPFFALNG